MVMALIIEDESGRAPRVAQLQEWADAFGMTFPVLADPNGTTMWSYAGGSGSVGLPFTVLIDRGVVVLDTNYPNEQDAVRAL